MPGERIDIETHEHDGGWEAEVTVVASDNTATEHRVTVSTDSFARLAPSGSLEKLVRASFSFLLEREPKESILREFDIEVIGRYFPEYERELGRRLGNTQS
jgi:hypothetical protein